jgi:hypothetical protein
MTRRWDSRTKVQTDEQAESWFTIGSQMRRVSLATVVLVLVASAKEKPTYPEHGTVVAMRSEKATSGTGVYTDSQGRTHGGQVHTRNVPVFKIHTSTFDYEVEGRRDLTIGEELNFRVDKRNLYIQRGDKEQKYSIVTEEKP